jgi:hypothetical protein
LTILKRKSKLISGLLGLIPVNEEQSI